MIELKFCPRCMKSLNKYFLYQDGFFDKYGICIECATAAGIIEIPPFNVYKVKNIGDNFTFEINLENCSRFVGLIFLQNRMRIHLAIERVGYFIFPGWGSLLEQDQEHYISSKLGLCLSDAIQLKTFLGILRERIIEVTSIDS